MEQLGKYIGVSEQQVPDRTGPDGPGLASEFRANFRSLSRLKPSLVMVGLERGDEWRFCVPVKYGEPLRLRVQRGMYHVTAWFFAEARALNAALMLVAIAEAEIVIAASSRADKFTLTGKEPEAAQLAQIRDAAPEGQPFTLPGDETRMLSDGRRRRELPGPPRLEEHPQLEMVCSPLSQPSAESTSGMEIVSWVASRPAAVSQGFPNNPST